MNSTQACLRPLANVARQYGEGKPDGLPGFHDEVLTLLWGPRFDREHALALWRSATGRLPTPGAVMLHDLLRVADRFDDLPPTEQHRLRHLVLRHRRRFALATD